jgi:hypothetical protein
VVDPAGSMRRGACRPRPEGETVPVVTTKCSPGGATATVALPVSVALLIHPTLLPEYSTN